MKACQQCESYISIHQIRKQTNGYEICELCETGRTNPFRVLEMLNENDNYYLPLQQDAIRLHKQTNLSPIVITEWFAEQLNKTPNNNGFDNGIKTEPVTLNDTEVCIMFY